MTIHIYTEIKKAKHEADNTDSISVAQSNTLAIHLEPEFNLQAILNEVIHLLLQLKVSYIIARSKLPQATA